MTPEDMKAMQQNNYNLFAAELLPVLLQGLTSSNCLTDGEKAFAQQLGKWNYVQDKDSLSPVLFEMWYQAFDTMTWDELDTAGIMKPEEWRVVEIARDYPQSKYFDQIMTMDKKETFPDIACASFAKMIKAYHNLPDGQEKNWGAYKQSNIPHLARFPHFGSDFIATSGGRHIINAMNKTHGPSWRMVVELSKPVKAWVNIPGGESGNPASPHFRDMLDHFFEGKYYEVSILKDPDAWTPTRQINITPQ
jgi:penicillin amidase